MTVLIRAKSVAPETINALQFVPNGSADYDFGRLSVLPTNFGAGEFTLRFRVRLMSAGSTAWGTIDTGSTASTKLRRWSTDNVAHYDGADWWYLGNFLIDGHNNNGTVYAGTFSVQVVNSGRLRWTFGDGAAADARTGDVHGVTATTSLLDGDWHDVALVRRWDGGTGAILEIWIDGVQEDTETTTARTNMYTSYWDDFSGYPAGQQNWYFGAEKIAAGTTGTNGGPDWEDAMFAISELAFFGAALSSGGGSDYTARITGSESNLLGYYTFSEQAGTSAGRSGGSGGAIALVNTVEADVWLSE